MIMLSFSEVIPYNLKWEVPQKVFNLNFMDDI